VVWSHLRGTWRIVRARVVLSLALALVSAACGDPSSAASRAAAPAGATSVKVVRLQLEPLARSITVSGTLAAEEQVTLGFKVTGRVEELRVDLGSIVGKGDVIARLTPTDFELRLRQSDAALQQARARLGLIPMATAIPSTLIRPLLSDRRAPP